MMSPRPSIHHQILSKMLLIIVLLSAAMGFIVWSSLHHIVERQLEKRGREIANHVALASGNYILMEDLYTLYELAEQTALSNEDVRYIFIIDHQKRLLAHTFREGIPKGLLEEMNDVARQQLWIFNSDEGRIHDIIVPVEHGEAGYVRVGMTETYMHTVMNQYIINAFVAVLVIFILALFFSSTISARITKPIRNLAQVAASITQGNLETRAEAGDTGEVGELAVAFNTMAASLIKVGTDKEALLGQLRAKDLMRDTLIKKLMTAQEDERKRISRELHDEISQALTSLMLTMRVLSEDAPNREQKDVLLLARDITADILRDVRDLAIELRPPALDDLGLVAAIERYCDKFAARHGLGMEIHISGDQLPVDGQIAVALYRIVQESLSNVARHADATTVSIAIAFAPERVTVAIADNGKGLLDADLIRAQKERRLGLYGMRERVELLQGRLDIGRSSRGGTELSIAIPLDQRGEGESS